MTPRWGWRRRWRRSRSLSVCCLLWVIVFPFNFLFANVWVVFPHHQVFAFAVKNHKFIFFFHLFYFFLLLVLQLLVGSWISGFSLSFLCISLEAVYSSNHNFKLPCLKALHCDEFVLSVYYSLLLIIGVSQKKDQCVVFTRWLTAPMPMWMDDDWLTWGRMFLLTNFFC